MEAPNMEALERIAEALERIASMMAEDETPMLNIPPYVPQATGHIPQPNRAAMALNTSSL
jgi:hypothetical protein